MYETSACGIYTQSKKKENKSKTYALINTCTTKNNENICKINTFSGHFLPQTQNTVFNRNVHLQLITIFADVF